jgi:hypothetical protein
MKKIIAIAVFVILALTGCHTTEPLIIVQREYVSVGVPEVLTRTEQIPAPQMSKEEYVNAKPKQREEAMVEYSRTLMSVIHTLNGRLTDISSLVKKQSSLIVEANEKAKKEVENEKARK